MGPRARKAKKRKQKERSGLGSPPKLPKRAAQEKGNGIAYSSAGRTSEKKGEG